MPAEHDEEAPERAMRPLRLRHLATSRYRFKNLDGSEPQPFSKVFKWAVVDHRGARHRLILRTRGARLYGARMVEQRSVGRRHHPLRALPALEPPRPERYQRHALGGFVVEGSEARLYHSGDTAYFEGFSEIGRRCGPIDAAILPIGAYDPQWFMSKQHINPEEAGRAYQDLGARDFVAMHWGTFQLTDEPLDEPPARLAAEWRPRPTRAVIDARSYAA